MRRNAMRIQALKYPLKMKGLIRIFIAIVMVIVGGALYADSGPETGPCADVWPKTIPSKDSLNLGDLNNNYYAALTPNTQRCPSTTNTFKSILNLIDPAIRREYGYCSIIGCSWNP